MSSFYGNYGADMTPEQISALILNHVIASKIQPTGQEKDDIWLVLKDNEEEEEYN